MKYVYEHIYILIYKFCFLLRGACAMPLLVFGSRQTAWWLLSDGKYFRFLHYLRGAFKSGWPSGDYGINHRFRPVDRQCHLSVTTTSSQRVNAQRKPEYERMSSNVFTSRRKYLTLYKSIVFGFALDSLCIITQVKPLAQFWFNARPA